MKTYEVDVFWSVGGSIPIQAENLDEAIRAAWEACPSDVGNRMYIDGSWVVDEQSTQDNYEHEEESCDTVENTS